MAETMDPILVKGLREAKQLHDNGILSLQEFEKEKQVLLQKRDLRLQREQARASFEDPEIDFDHGSQWLGHRWVLRQTRHAT